VIFGVFGPPRSISSHQLSSPRRRRSATICWRKLYFCVS